MSVFGLAFVIVTTSIRITDEAEAVRIFNGTNTEGVEYDVGTGLDDDYPADNYAYRYQYGNDDYSNSWYSHYDDDYGNGNYGNGNFNADDDMTDDYYSGYYDYNYKNRNRYYSGNGYNFRRRLTAP